MAISIINLRRLREESYNWAKSLAVDACIGNWWWESHALVSCFQMRLAYA